MDIGGRNEGIVRAGERIIWHKVVSKLLLEANTLT